MISDGLKQELLEFRTKREWEQFHNFRTLSASLVLEAAELLELTQWALDKDLETIITRKRKQIEQELADIAILLTYLAHDLDIDIEAAVSAKLLLNQEKYPVDRSRGSSRKYNELDK